MAKKVRTDDGDTEVVVARLSYRECLTPVRAFYLDLAQWAIEDPERWGAWVARSPVGEEEGIRAKATRQRKARMDARTRARLPALPALVRALNEKRKATAALLDAGRSAEPGEAITHAGSRLVRRKRADGIWVDDLERGTRRDLTSEEANAFWAWATVEILRSTGIRVEELLELSHHSLVQYRLPTTGELVPLLQIAPSKTDSERLVVVSPELAEVLSAVICRSRGHHGAVPLVSTYDDYERVWLAPAPRLLQRCIHGENRGIAHSCRRSRYSLAGRSVQTWTGKQQASTKLPLSSRDSRSGNRGMTTAVRRITPFPSSGALGAEVLPVGQSTVSHHLAAVAVAGFVHVGRYGTSSLYAVNPRCVECFPTAADLVVGRRPPPPTCAPMAGGLGEMGEGE